MSEETNAPVDTPPKKTRKELVDLTTAKGDSASHTSLSSLEDTSLSNKGSCFNASNKEEDSLSAADGG